MEIGNRGRFCIKILIVGILISHEAINNCRGVEGMTTQTDADVVKMLLSQSEEITKMVNDINSIRDQMKKTDSSIGKITGVGDCCSGLGKEIKINQQLLNKIEAMLVDCTMMTSTGIISDVPTEVGFSNKSGTPSTSTVYKDCSEFKRMGYSSGPYRISPNNKAIAAYCDFDTPGGDWLVFQRRRDGSVDFRQNWDAYANGFGNADGEFWLGNEVLYQMTSNRKYKLRIDLEDFENQKRFAEYSSFSVGPSSDYYRLTIGRYSGNAGDSMRIHTNLQFSTVDADHDAWKQGNCAKVFHGAWWYGKCHSSNLNGIFYKGVHKSRADGVNWFSWRGLYYSLKSEMKIAPSN